MAEAMGSGCAKPSDQPDRGHKYRPVDPEAAEPDASAPPESRTSAADTDQPAATGTAGPKGGEKDPPIARDDLADGAPGGPLRGLSVEYLKTKFLPAMDINDSSDAKVSLFFSLFLFSLFFCSGARD